MVGGFFLVVFLIEQKVLSIIITYYLPWKTIDEVLSFMLNNESM